MTAMTTRLSVAVYRVWPGSSATAPGAKPSSSSSATRRAKTGRSGGCWGAAGDVAVVIGAADRGCGRCRRVGCESWTRAAPSRAGGAVGHDATVPCRRSSSRPSHIRRRRPRSVLLLRLPVGVGDADHVGVDDPVALAADRHGRTEDEVDAVLGWGKFVTLGADR